MKGNWKTNYISFENDDQLLNVFGGDRKNPFYNTDAIDTSKPEYFSFISGVTPT